MESDKTVRLKPPDPISVRIGDGVEAHRALQFSDVFRIGRGEQCDVRIKHAAVSRVHAEVSLDGAGWRVRDAGSSNGTYLNGVRIQESVLPHRAKLELGSGGPVVWLEVRGATERPGQTSPTTDVEPSVTQFIDRYAARGSSEPAGTHTMMMRRAFERVRTRQAKKYWAVLAVAAVLLVGAGGVVVYQQTKLGQLRETAENLFYTMKAVELQVATVEDLLSVSGSSAQRSEIAAKRQQLKDMERDYDTFVGDLGVYGKHLSEEDRLILRIARIFGECELTMPPGFVAEVRHYISKWKATGRLDTAIRRAVVNGYVPLVADEMLTNYLPPQFFYLGLQESNFETRSVGPPTRYGFAKGPWQFIPITAAKYGLQTGPLLELASYDPRDERHDFSKATRAAARYLRDLYSTEAQASGLLVMASYNWGEDRVRPLIAKMPNNPRERNFWRLLEAHAIPQETYDYVFYIVSAAVIGENPKLFGFEFENPLSIVKADRPAGERTM